MRVERCKHYFSVEFVYLKCEITILFCISSFFLPMNIVKVVSSYLVVVITQTFFCIRQLFEIKL